jgi:midasin
LLPILGKSNDYIPLEPTNTFIKICQYFNQRYTAYKLAKQAENKTEDYKYKTYGQKETAQELEDKELAEHFPTYVKYFNDFVRSELNDDRPKTEEIDHKEGETSESNEKNNSLIDIEFLMKSFDLIEIFIDLQQPASQINETDFFDRNLLKTFYNSYSLGTKIKKAYAVQPRNNTRAGSLQSHILYSSSINFNNLSYFISNHKYIYDFYKDPNQTQVIKCKEVLKQFYKRIEHLLNEWENNPILIELIKLVKRIESFDLNDSLMKYLTGLELLVEKAQSWQLVESKMTSIEAEIKQVSLLIVEWRKFELTYWQKSLDIELMRMRNKTAQNWFNHVFSICTEFLKGQVDTDEFLFTLKQFMELSLTGDYFIRLKQLKLCANIFVSNEQLTDCLWSVFSCYDTLYSKLINENIANEKQSIEKELKDFIDICRWQDMNYWALKQSVIKYNKGLFKIIKKFRSFLNQKIDLVHPKVANSLAKHLIGLNLSKLNLTMPKKKLDELFLDKMPVLNQKHYDKMKLICKKSLQKKCCKHNFNAALAEFSSQNYQLFYDLNQMSNNLNQQYEQNKTNKETVGKHKKDIKNLLTQKLKYLSDLMKQLAHIGLSYRRGNLQIASQQETISQVLSFKPCVYSFQVSSLNPTPELEIGEHFNETNFAYFLCLDRFMSFKQLLDTREINTANKYTHLVPVEKFRGYVEHFFHLVHEQKQQLHSYLNDLFCFKSFKQTVNGIVSSVGLNAATHDLTSYSATKSFIVKTFEKTKQVELFFKSVSSSGLIMNSFEAIKEKLSKQEQLLTDLKHDTHSSHPTFRFKFPDESFSIELAKFKENYSLNSDLNKNLNDLNSLSAQDCTPFEEVFRQILSQFESLNRSDSERQSSIVIYF